jgi:D-glycero-alpha-D-manno-heptose-7-phosphate kinase
MIITKTPYRLSFFGGGTDYMPWAEAKGGLIIAAAVARYCYITVRYLPPFFDHKFSVAYSKVERVESAEEIEHPSVRNCLKYLKFCDGVEIHHDGDLPARSGIGSSSSFTVGLLNALHALRHEIRSERELADEAIHVEQDLIGEDVGIQDQVIAAYGGVRLLEIKPGGEYVAKPLILSPDYLKELEESVLMGFSGISRYATKYAKAQIENINNGSAEKNLSEILCIAKEALALMHNKADIKEIGSLLDKSWMVKKTLADGISNNTVDELYATAKKAGAYGGKLMGAGGGGFVMFLAPPERHAQIKNALRGIVKVWVPFKMDHTGSQVIFHNSTEAESLK